MPGPRLLVDIYIRATPAAMWGRSSTLVHDDFDGETRTCLRAADDWSLVLSGVKTWLETGISLQVRAPGRADRPVGSRPR